MFYRVIIFAIGLLLILLTFGLMWGGAALFMRSMGDTERLFERSRIIAVWTFAGFGVGLLFMGFGGPILGTFAFFRSARGVMPQIHEATVLLWGFSVVLVSSALAGGLLFGGLYLVA
ncbi:hypothetical protein DES49_2525 [Halospina denitrificans]|uniref:Uncharacterized protein n=1 Tax=Halospina denitrificans TaxID=332522 RepID=A0A4V3EPM8_9GAMM|nr:hypothetical protein [Halospina denitrificans]TDT38548.1 hypothetical protein DES49_2525 [Halospina denitrificans]